VNPAPLPPDSAARIFTGAVVPAGADAVVMQEDCELVDGLLQVRTAVTRGDHIRPSGQDIAPGATVLAQGRRLQPQDLGVLASLGIETLAVAPRLKVAILSTGDELREPGQPLEHCAQLYNSNRYTLSGLLTALGCDVVDGGIIPDDPAATAAALQRAAAQSDLVVTSGGVSVGEEDHVKTQVEALGELDLWKLAIKPGKPLAFGRIAQTPFFGLPGNPVSVFVTFVLVVRPWILKRLGASRWRPLALPAVADFDVPRPGGRQEYLRVRLDTDSGQLCASRLVNQSSGVLTSLSESEALAVVPAGTTMKRGDPVQVLLLEALAG
jgi:molybdopterin molybdotransferase